MAADKIQKLASMDQLSLALPTELPPRRSRYYTFDFIWKRQALLRQVMAFRFVPDTLPIRPRQLSETCREAEVPSECMSNRPDLILGPTGHLNQVNHFISFYQLDAGRIELDSKYRHF
jgi:hypothetical protein